MKKKSLTILTTIAILLLLPNLLSAQELEYNTPDYPTISLVLAKWRLDVEGFVRTNTSFTTSNDDAPKEYKDNTFTLLSENRLKFTVNYDDKFKSVFTIEGDTKIKSKVNKPKQNFLLKDAYLEYKFASFLKIRAGNYKPPTNLEYNNSSTENPFAERSIISNGTILGHDKGTKPSHTFKPGRHLAFSILSSPIDLKYILLNYHLAFSNGKDVSKSTDDDTFFASTFRLEFELPKTLIGDYTKDPFLTLGLGLQHQLYNLTPPDINGVKQDNILTSAFFPQVDLTINYLNIEFLFEAIFRRALSKHDPNNKIGILTQLTYMLPFKYLHLKMGYRFAYLNRFKNQSYTKLEDNEAMAHSIMLAYYFDQFPLSIKFDYSINYEGSDLYNGTARSLTFKKMSLVAQFKW